MGGEVSIDGCGVRFQAVAGSWSNAVGVRDNSLWGSVATERRFVRRYIVRGERVLLCGHEGSQEKDGEGFEGNDAV